MGWRTNQVSSDDDGSDWTPSSLQDPRLLPTNRQQHLQHQLPAQSEQVKCPRCGSTNTKFCYYNNYNKSQPRHFCKTCKRHWTKGGILRNVPVGGIRKNKRARTKTSPPATSLTTSERFSQEKHRKLIVQQPSPLLQPTFRDAPSVAADRSVLQDFDNQFPWPCSIPFEVSSWQHPILADTTTATTAMSLNFHQPWTFGSSCPEAVGNNMIWDELDKLVSANLNNPWDDMDIKLP